MIALTADSRIVLARTPIDFRKGIDGIGGIVRQSLGGDPKCSTFFVFINRSKTMVRVLHYSKGGYWLLTRRLSCGRFPWWPSGSEDATRELEAGRLIILLWGENPYNESISRHWQRIN